MTLSGPFDVLQGWKVENPDFLEEKRFSDFKGFEKLFLKI